MSEGEEAENRKEGGRRREKRGWKQRYVKGKKIRAEKKKGNEGKEENR